MGCWCRALATISFIPYHPSWAWTHSLINCMRVFFYSSTLFWFTNKRFPSKLKTSFIHSVVRWFKLMRMILRKCSSQVWLVSGSTWLWYEDQEARAWKRYFSHWPARRLIDLLQILMVYRIILGLPASCCNIWERTSINLDTLPLCGKMYTSCHRGSLVGNK